MTIIPTFFAEYAAGKMLDKLPGWVGRWFVSPERLAKLVEIDLHPNVSVDISYGGAIPRVDMCFRIDNRSSAPLVLDRLVFDLWVGQPILRGAVLARYDIPKWDKVHIPFWDQITPSQQKFVASQVHNGFFDEVVLSFEAWFDSKIGRIHVQDRITRRKVPYDGPTV
jgi:hypothetical protein